MKRRGRKKNAPNARAAWVAAWEGPFHVWCGAPRAVRVQGQHFASDCLDHDGRLFVVPGLTPLHMLGPTDHILVSRELSQVLTRLCPDQAEFVDAVIETGRFQLTGYVELRLHRQIAREDILSAKEKRPGLWRYGNEAIVHLFVTKPVVEAIQQARILALHFAPGLSDFLD